MRYNHSVVGGRLILRTLTLRNGIYYCWIRDTETGRNIRRSTRERTKWRARRVAERIAERELARLEGAVEAAHVDSALAEWLSVQRVGATTYRDYASCVRMLTGLLAGLVRDVRYQHVERIVDELARTRSARTARKYLIILRSFFRWAKLRRYCSVDPTQGLNPPKGPATREGRLLVREEISALFSEVKRHHFRYVLVGLHTGLRNANILGARWDRIDLKERSLTVPAPEYKARRVHTVPIHRELAEYMRLWKRDGSPYVLGRRFSDLHAGFNAACARAGFQASHHDLRHTFSTWVQSRFPWAIAETLAGRKLPGAGGRYWHPQFEQLRDAIDQLPRLLSKRRQRSEETTKGRTG